jgi:hypothetical protein
VDEDAGEVVAVQLHAVDEELRLQRPDGVARGLVEEQVVDAEEPILGSRPVALALDLEVAVDDLLVRAVLGRDRVVPSLDRDADQDGVRGELHVLDGRPVLENRGRAERHVGVGLWGRVDADVETHGW